MGIETEYASWESPWGEPELVVEEVEGLTVSGRGVEILVGSPYSRVLCFRGCSTLALRELSLGHAVSEPCMAGVLGFEGCAAAWHADPDTLVQGSLLGTVLDSLRDAGIEP